MTEKLAVITNMVTMELQTEYKSGRSALDILSIIINKQIKMGDAKHILMMDLQNAFD